MKLRSSWPAVVSTIRSIRGRGKLSLRVGLVDNDEVNAEPPFVVCLFDKDYISQPVKVFYFSDNFGLEEFVNLFIDYLLPFWGETPSFLFDRFEGGADVQLVCDYCGVNSSHILLLPGEYFYILF